MDTPKVTSVPTIEPLHYVPFAEMREPGWPVPAPIGRLDDHDRPEPDTTFYEPGIFAAGTAIASTTPRVRQGSLGNRSIGLPPSEQLDAG
jgi:hypothetical protein